MTELRFTESQSEWAGRDLRAHSVPITAVGWMPPDQAAQGPILLFEHLQGRSIHTCLGSCPSTPSLQQAENDEGKRLHVG